MIQLTVTEARRLVVRGALLAGPGLPANADGIMGVVRHLGSLQIDPTRTVERTHLLVLWSRLGAYDPAVLDRLLWEERRLFEYAAFIVPTESFPEQAFKMGRFATGDGAWQRRVRDWLEANDGFRRAVLDRLRDEGPLPARAIKAPKKVVDWPSSGWTAARNVTQMLEFLWRRGEILVAGRAGGQRLWNLPERVLPPWTPRETLDAAGFAERLVDQALRRMGVATEREIVERRSALSSAEVRSALAEMEAQGRLRRVRLPAEEAFIRTEDEGALDALRDRPGWQPMTTLLSPFDPLITDRERTERLFRFSYRLEMYVPRAERRYGHFVLPILHGDRLVGRLDPRMDRRSGVLTIANEYWEAARPPGQAVRRAVRTAVDELGRFLGAREVDWPAEGAT